MRGVVLPADTHRIAFVYRPISFYAGPLISPAAWLIFGAAFFFASLFGCMNRFQFTGTSFG